jgi:hypothetical protein
MHAIAAPARVRLTRRPLAPTASRRHRRGAVIAPNAALYPRDDDADGKDDKRAKRRRTWGQAIGVLAVPLGIHALITPDAAHAAGGWYNDVQLGPRSDGGFIGGGASGGAGDATPAFGYEDRGDDYDYRYIIFIFVRAISLTTCFFFYSTKDLAVDLASPLVAYKVVSWALNQEVPRWLDAIILAFTLAAVYVCIFDVDALDGRLQ